MAESRTNGGGSRSTFSVHPAPEVSPEISTHESGDGAGGSGGGGDDGLKKGDTLGRYLVLEQLGAGAMGVVYAAYDPELDRKIAIKILRPQEGKGDKTRRQERLVREAKAMAKLSHPNVGAIYDVGVHGDQVFLAMEFLSGGTLRAWMAKKKRPWREVVDMFIQVGKGLAGAHAEGLIHRDFKPDNVLLDKNDVPKVVDFGLVRLTGAALDRSTAGSMDAITDEEVVALPLAQTALAANLTRTGALTGTPAYMAPEQFLGKPIDARTDQFAFCVALYEALYGERPFAGETIFQIADAVTQEQIRPLPKNNEIPAWLRRCLIRGLRTDPTLRYQDIRSLLTSIERDPVARRRRQALFFAGSTIATLLLVLGVRSQVHKRAEVESQIKRHLDEAANASALARATASEIAQARSRAYRLFDDRALSDGETVWRKSLSQLGELSRQQNLAVKSFEAALAVMPERGDSKARLSAWICEALAQWHALGIEGDTLSRYTRGLPYLPSCGAGAAGLGKLSVEASVPADLTIERYAFDDEGVPSKIETRRLGRLPLAETDLQPGSLGLWFRGLGSRETYFPVFVRAGSKTVVNVVLPRSPVPKGFVYVPKGTFFFGDDNEDLRTGFLGAVPLHEIGTDAFLIALHEVTYADWIKFLDDQPGEKRNVLGPRVASAGFRGALELRQSPSGWQIRIQISNRSLTAYAGQVLTYPARERNRSVDWLRMPVTGVSADDIETYLAWYGTKHQVAVRLCDEREWERAARGADRRVFPHGMHLNPGDANYDETYGHDPLAQGPDPVGSFPQSRSPFGLDDMTGNAMELTKSALDDGVVVRGGAYYFGSASCRLTNRYSVAHDLRDRTAGFRLCADGPS